MSQHTRRTGQKNAKLEDELMGCKEVTIRNYFDHLDEKWCKMDTTTRKKTKGEFDESWDQVMHITKFGKKLRKHQEYLKVCGVKIDNETKMQFYVEEMIDSAMFEKCDIVAWENADDKCYNKVTSFFEKLVDNKETYTSVVGGKAKRGRFESAKTRASNENQKMRVSNATTTRYALMAGCGSSSVLSSERQRQRRNACKK